MHIRRVTRGRFAARSIMSVHSAANAAPTGQAAATDETAGGQYRWLICGLLFFATTINYIDRQILSLIKPILDNQLHWSNEQFGRANAMFQASYAVGGLLFGKFIDRFGTKIGYATSIAAWSVAAAAHALVGSISGFYMARAALGLGEAGNFPSAIKAVALWFPKKERTLATTLFNSGANVGAMIAPAIVPWLAFTWGWHSAFIAAGAAGMLWLLLWIPLYNVPERIHRLSHRELEYIRSEPVDAAAAQNISWRALWGYRQTWSFVIAKLLTDPVWWFFLIWLPDFFKKTRHLDIKTSWVHLVTIYGLVTVLSNLGGWLTGVIAGPHSGGRSRKVVMLAAAFAVVPITLVTRVGDWGAVLLIGLAASAHQIWSANLFTSVSDMFPKRAIGSVIGLGGMAGSFAGMAFPIFSGKLLDRFEAVGKPSAGYAILFVICGSAYLLAFVINHLLAPRFEPIVIKD
jgi:ACS family hexuronate transporter-like MFS transporter